MERPNEQYLRYDDISLENIAKIYPEEMREPFKWLGWYIREECARDLDVFMGIARELNINHDKTTWSKIIRGRWQIDAEGNVEKSPCLALEKFLKAVNTLKDDHRVREMSGKIPFIITETSQQIWDFIDVRRAPDRINRFGIVIGHTGLQKTATLREYARQHNHGLCTWQEAPSNGSMTEFVSNLSVKYGGSITDSPLAKMRRVNKTVKSRHTIIVDNAQTLYRPDRKSDQPVFNFLRALQDERQCTIIYSFTFEFYQKLKDELLQSYFEQFEGRAGGRRNFLMLPEHPTEDDVLAFARAFKMENPEKHLEQLVGIAREPGRVRRLLEDLQQAKSLAESTKAKLTIKHVNIIRGED